MGTYSRSSVGCIGRTKAISSACASTATPRRKNRFSAASRFSVCAKRTFRSRWSSSRVRRVFSISFAWHAIWRVDTVTDFSWEPKGERFAIVASSDPNLGNPGPGVTIKTDVSFYRLDRSKNDFKLLRGLHKCLHRTRALTFSSLGTLAGRTTNTIRWSPRGRHVVLATVGSTSKSELEFWDLDFNSDDVTPKRDPPKEEWGTGIQQLGTADHYGVTDVEWDPSGRYLATAASAWTHTVRALYTQCELTYSRTACYVDRKRIRDLGFPRTRNRKTAPRPLQTVPLASPSPLSPNQRSKTRYPPQPARVCACV
jgi:WD40 repeat protein